MSGRGKRKATPKVIEDADSGSTPKGSGGRASKHKIIEVEGEDGKKKRIRSCEKTRCPAKRPSCFAKAYEK